MDAFHWIVVPISTVLGLTIARVLAAYVAAFKARRRVRFDWIALLFAGVVLGEGLQFWWALLELSVLPSWSLASFTLLIAMVMSLFIAGSIVVPSEMDSDMRLAFERDGRWALLALACFHGLAILGNFWLWRVAVLSPVQGLQLALATLCLVGALSHRRQWHAVVAILYLALGIADTFLASIEAY
ncbi:MAG: hypothetical protein U1E34_00975 [Amaricoccus sp.]